MDSPSNQASQELSAVAVGRWRFAGGGLAGVPAGRWSGGADLIAGFQCHGVPRNVHGALPLCACDTVCSDWPPACLLWSTEGAAGRGRARATSRTASDESVYSRDPVRAMAQRLRHGLLGLAAERIHRQAGVAVAGHEAFPTQRRAPGWLGVSPDPARRSRRQIARMRDLGVVVADATTRLRAAPGARPGERRRPRAGVRRRLPSTRRPDGSC